MNVFIPSINFSKLNKKGLFILVRPFLGEEGWTNTAVARRQFDLSDSIQYTSDVANADCYLIPFPIQNYTINELAKINKVCTELEIKALGVIGGDFGIAFPKYSNIIYYRLGGFTTQLDLNNKGFPVALSDHYQRLYHQEHPVPIAKKTKVKVGFCGHATLSQSKRVKELLKCIKENLRRFFENPIRKDWEPLFASAYERAKMLQILSESNVIDTNFIFRENYRAGVKSSEDLQQTTLEYYNNIAHSDYVLCLRGGGNFSVRFYETLMMGKIPVFINTDCLLPFPNQIDWKKHVVWVEWKDRAQVAEKLVAFHQQLTDDEFIQLQINNRKLWKEQLSVSGLFELIKNDI